MLYLRFEVLRIHLLTVFVLLAAESINNIAHSLLFAYNCVLSSSPTFPSRRNTIKQSAQVKTILSANTAQVAFEPQQKI